MSDQPGQPGAGPRARDEAAIASLTKHLSERKSVRGYKPEPLSRAQITELFAMAQRAASWCNTQPWRVAVTMPPLTKIVSDELVAGMKSGFPSSDMPFPLNYPEPHASHRKECGAALYNAMGIARDDKAGRYGAWMRNYELFDAPHVAVVSVSKQLGPYALIDVGVWLGVLMTCAQPLGIDMCTMASVALYPQSLRKHLAIDEGDAVLFGIALGIEDAGVPANACRTTRSDVADNVRILDASAAAVG